MKKILFFATAIIACSTGALGFHYLNTPAQPEYALYYQQSRLVKPFQLVDQNGNSFTNKQLTGKWSFVFFGYTSCPDVCPNSLQSLHFIYDELLNISKDSQVLLVSVDPKRDSQNTLAQYINYFNPAFIGLRAEHDVLYPFARNLGMMYAITEAKVDKGDSNSYDSYQVDHSASLALINPEGNISAIFKAEQEVGQIAAIDTEKLLSDYQKIVALF